MRLERPKPRKGEAKAAAPAAYTAEEVSALLSALREEPLKWQALVHILTEYGNPARRVLRSKREDVDFKTGEITITKNLCYTPTKGVYMDTPKSGQSRAVYVGDDTIALLRMLRTEQASKAVSAYIFTREGSPEPMHPQSPTRYLKKLSKRCGLPDLHPHRLRQHLRQRCNHERRGCGQRLRSSRTQR
ncbi:MAG: tyrosine-type recombinase/integrase [Oscillospiraceae bacterium]